MLLASTGITANSVMSERKVEWVKAWGMTEVGEVASDAVDAIRSDS